MNCVAPSGDGVKDFPVNTARCYVGWIVQVAIELSIFRLHANDLLIRPCGGTDYPSVDSVLADRVLAADGSIHPTFHIANILHGVALRGFGAQGTRFPGLTPGTRLACYQIV